MGAKILIVDDQPAIVSVIENYLKSEDYRTVIAFDGIAARKLIATESPDLIILDWMLPEMNGLELCKEIRHESSIPIIMLTAKAEETDRVLGLEYGADDYIVKPFGLRELVARIKTVLRRVSPGQDASLIITHRDLKIDMKAHRIWKRNVEVILTPTEFKILCLLASHPGVPYSRLQLLNQAMGEEYLYYERSVDTHIFNLRKKIEDTISEPSYIQTVFGIGYRMGDEK
ncbi:response regulator transcription factor [Dehalobacter sp. TeCB1]|uniref:response regulator n=1 Tax=Dehalobacter sp. TeCB1 TaxID=1843715 RepID=UPI00083A5F17|nr:response regulator transcription factor [Dehalobacter sp. TeCB1]OCZ49695.1 DNA-binding response regulator [Dehalobacter sp. TeCB1]